MTDRAAILTLVRWLSPAFPVGGFAHSHGLEAAVADGSVRDAEAAEAWILAVVTAGSGRADAVLLCAARVPGADLVALGAEARALAASSERDAETMRQGRAFALAVAPLLGRAVAPAPLPVVVGDATRTLGLPHALVAALYLQAFAANLVHAAIRLVPLGQSAGQAILARLAPAIEAAADVAARTPVAAIASATPRADIASMRHETLPVRLFVS